ncbi:MarR family transcriptional regulator [Providencia sp. wls1943]|uniref:MarR family winged helix-turn-helix transcriptional regulator n=1 Tax=unclassified Providencia TaxID=2633465 RepID=UPI0012B5A417|nr:MULTISPECIES: MarR family winged helix-turn-helix transcriptional regulator [unclassified Providencia]MTB67026.1 MarR family transcriptional regulator [Providencia sp. wls1943]
MRKSKVNTSMIPEIGEGKRGESGHIGYLLRQAHAAHRIRMEQVLQDVGVTLPQFSVLLMVAEYPKASGADLARLSLLTPQTMSVIVKNLEKAGMISKLPHPEHGRIQIIEITQLGEALLRQCKGAVKSTENRLLSGVSESDEKVIRKWLVDVAKQFDIDKA